MTTRADRKAHAKYMREWRAKRKDQLRLLREDLTNLFIGVDLRKRWLLKRIRKGDNLNVALFQMALDKNS